MTTSQSINDMVEQLAQAGALEPARFEALLGAALTPESENPYWRFYRFTLPAGPFAGGELRLSTAGTGALLILEPRDPPGLSAGDLDRAAWGPVRSLQPNPRIPPEGADTYVYDRAGVLVSVQLTHQSRRVRALTLEWRPSPAPA